MHNGPKFDLTPCRIDMSQEGVDLTTDTTSYSVRERGRERERERERVGIAHGEGDEMEGTLVHLPFAIRFLR